ncbi:MAG: ComEA family DNA-binding protein [Phycisphaerales bacterium JB037]
MPAPQPAPPHDRAEPAWVGIARGPGKWTLILVLGLASLGGMIWSASAIAHRRAAERIGYDRRIDLNAAGPAELQTLPGIGPALAERIVESRAADGPFADLQDLQRVSGIGERTAAELEPFVLFGPGG